MMFSNGTDAKIGELAHQLTLLILYVRQILPEVYELKKKGKL